MLMIGMMDYDRVPAVLNHDTNDGLVGHPRDLASLARAPFAYGISPHERGKPYGSCHSERSEESLPRHANRDAVLDGGSLGVSRYGEEVLGTAKRPSGTSVSPSLLSPQHSTSAGRSDAAGVIITRADGDELTGRCCRPVPVHCLPSTSPRRFDASRHM